MPYKNVPGATPTFHGLFPGSTPYFVQIPCSHLVCTCLKAKCLISEYSGELCSSALPLKVVPLKHPHDFYISFILESTGGLEVLALYSQLKIS